MQFQLETPDRGLTRPWLRKAIERITAAAGKATDRAAADARDELRAAMRSQRLGGPGEGDRLDQRPAQEAARRPRRRPRNRRDRHRAGSVGTDQGGGVVTGHVAEARVGYTGSPLLWHLKPAKGFRFPYRGRVAEASVGMRAYWEGMDLTSFAKQVEDDLTRAREAVAAYRSEIEKWNEAIRRKISDTVRSF